MGLGLVRVHSSTLPAATVVSVLAALNSRPLMVKPIMAPPIPMPAPEESVSCRCAATAAVRRSSGSLPAGKGGSGDRGAGEAAVLPATRNVASAAPVASGWPVRRGPGPWPIMPAMLPRS
ncbi:hypothetical protein D9M72_539190 [compost metagenome]